MLSHHDLQADSSDAGKSESKPVRMRAGFGVFQPSRVGRLLEEAKASNDAATSIRDSSRPPSEGSTTGADTQASAQVPRPLLSDAVLCSGRASHSIDACGP